MIPRVHFPVLSLAGLLIAGAILLDPTIGSAHCDTYAGPVIATAKQALEKGDVTPLLKWVEKEDEEQIKAAFKRTLIVRAKGVEAKELADQFFFETLVRIHRTGEGAPFTGLKNIPIEPMEAMADKALETGNVDSLANIVATHVKEGIKERFSKALKAKKDTDKSVDAGREYVEAYISYLHYVIGIHSATVSKGEHHGDAEEGEKASGRHHE
jgi:hypothetical protein